jgi:putative MATE family efflux protein
MFTTMTVFWGLSTGVTVVIAHLWGAGRQNDAAKAAFTGFLTCLLLTAACSLIGATWGEKIPVLMGANTDVQHFASGYIRLVFTWMVWTTGLNVLSAIMHGTGDTRTPMEAIILVNILHVLLAWPLIYGKFGLPALGVKGAAIAINTSEFFGFTYLLIQALRKGYLHIGWPDSVLFGRIWRISWPVALERIAQQSGQLFYSSFIIAYGTTAYAAHQIGLSIESLSFMPGAGMGIAASALMGQALGSGKIRRARISHNEALRLAIGLMTIMALLFFCAPHYLISLFSSDADVIEKGSVFLRLVAFAQLPLAISFVCAGSLRATGDTFYVFVVTLVAMWGIRVALSWVASSWLHLSLYAVWGMFLIDWYFRGAAFAWRYRKRDLHSVIV